MARKTPEPARAQALSEYVVLRGMVLDDGARKALGLENTMTRALWTPVLNMVAEQGPDGEVRVVRAPGKSQAIRQVTGDGPEVVEGIWKAIPLSSWKGGEQTKRITASDRLGLDEAWA